MSTVSHQTEHLEVKPNVFYKLDEVAVLMRVSKKSISDMLNSGLAPAIKIGRQWRILGQDLLELPRSSQWDDHLLIQAMNKLSEPAFAEVWDNEEDAVYDNL